MIGKLIFGFLFSNVLCLLVIRYKHLHAHFTSDSSIGPQKFHKIATPRIGGVPIFITLVIMWLWTLLTDPSLSYKIPLFMSALLLFIVGVVEDITKKVGVKMRLIFAFISGIVAFIYFDVRIHGLGIPFIDIAFSYYPIALLFTAFAIAGVSNAYNIIDGFNGLASMVSVICLLAITLVAFKVGDMVIINLALTMIVAILGFFMWNYPKGLIFLGDGGAYLIGFWTAVLSILVVSRNPTVSPWFALMVNAYPITETLFTIWRRSIHQGKNPGLPDAAHFHSLIYRRVVRWSTPFDEKAHARPSGNAATSPYLWLLSSLGVIPAIVFWDSTLILIISGLFYVSFYIWAYRQIVVFKSKKVFIKL
jgi:UDP-N-acetylmuramyl pentapeptide phosphotransferase/UDP-N-acetylglucosamine-1-phosphate transferase